MADSPDKDEEIKAEIAGYNSDEGVPFQFRTHKQRSDRSNKERDSIEDTIKHKIYEKSMKGKKGHQVFLHLLLINKHQFYNFFRTLGFRGEKR